MLSLHLMMNLGQGTWFECAFEMQSPRSQRLFRAQSIIIIIIIIIISCCYCCRSSEKSLQLFRDSDEAKRMSQEDLDDLYRRSALSCHSLILRFILIIICSSPSLLEAAAMMLFEQQNYERASVMYRVLADLEPKGFVCSHYSIFL